VTGLLRSSVVVLLYLAVATSLGHVDYHIRGNPERGFREYSPGVIAGTEPPPGRYRVLAPYVYRGLTRLTGWTPRASWVLFRWLSLLGALLAFHWYAATWFDRGPAVAGTLLVAALLPLTFTNSWAHPDHLVELALFTLACACIARDRTGWFVVVLAANALNRETSVFLLPLFLLARPITRARLLAAAGLSALWLAIYVGLRWGLGFQTYDPWQWDRNLVFLRLLPPAYDPYYRAYAWFAAVLIVPLVWAAWRARQVLPRVLRMGAFVITPAFVVVALLFSSVIETRIFTPVLPLAAPAVLFALFGRSRPANAASVAAG
jgi:hypothetical protein